MLSVAPSDHIRRVAESYMRERGLRYNPPRRYARVDESRARRIARAFDEMRHEPDHPLVRASYEALARETKAQYDHAKRHGLVAEFWHPDRGPDPYGPSPRLATEDAQRNNHLYVFPTVAGYGGGKIPEDELRENPMLSDTGERWGGHPVLLNDLFRAVHDYYGHAKESVGFRADGEENAWRSHAAMYSPLARIAATTETRGQNSWLNYGPHGDHNRTAPTEDTVYAEQKLGALPRWALSEGAEDFETPEDREEIDRLYRAYGRHHKAEGGALWESDDPMAWEDVPPEKPHVSDDPSVDPEFESTKITYKPKRVQTVKNATGMLFPDIYKNPRELAHEASSRVAPESAALKRLFGVTRHEMYERGAHRKGNMDFKLPFKGGSRMSPAVEGVMAPRNERRLQDIISEALKHEDLKRGMMSWYYMDPVIHALKQVMPEAEAAERYRHLNMRLGMMSPGSEVPTEINRGLALDYLLNQGRYSDFKKFGGLKNEQRRANFPADIKSVIAHPYHATAHRASVDKYVETGDPDMGSAKVPTYIAASGVPETGFQTSWPVADAHFTRLLGLPDTRGGLSRETKAVAMKLPEYKHLGPWFRERVAKKVGVESVPAQALLWGAGSGATGVSSPIGSSKLEMLADHIMRRAKAHGVSPEEMRDRVLRGTHYDRGGSVEAALQVARRA